MITLIGGPARCGKSTLAHTVERLQHGQSISLDNLRHSFAAIASDSVRATLLAAPSHQQNPPEQWLKVLRERDRTAWIGTKAYLAAAAANNDTLLAEGNLWPDYVAELEADYKAVFLVDTSDDHVDRLVEAAQNDATHNNWQQIRGESWIRTWAEYNVYRSKVYKELAIQYGQPVFDARDLGVEGVQTAALDYLI